MERLTTTSFGTRQVTYAQIQAARAVDLAEPAPEDDKWALFRDLTTARAAFGVSSRDLSVLNALLSFLPGQGMDADDLLVVFPSNASLAERAHGMAESTLRRHLAALSAAGLILRHDSPNGKRYAVRGAGGEIVRAFGLDLRPLLIRAAEIRVVAAEVRAAATRLKALRERVSLRLRDLERHVVFAMELGRDGEGAFLEGLAALKRRWRRKLSFAAVEGLSEDAEMLLGAVIRAIDADGSKEMGGNDVGNERRYQNSKPDTFESEPCLEKQEDAAVRRRPSDNATERLDRDGEGVSPSQSLSPPQSIAPSVSLALVLTAAQEIALYADGPIRSWRDLCAAAAFVRGMMGISPDAWAEAERAMGRETAAIAVACMLERSTSIRSPGGYLRALTDKAREGAFSPGPMVMAVLNGKETVAA